MYNDILKALELSSKTHKHQRRTFSNEPYINHPIRLANNPLVVSLGSDAICVALLHDCIEDGEYPEEVSSYISKNFNFNIYDTCLLLTHNRLLEDYNSYTNKIKLSNNKIALAVKYADSLDNSRPESSMSEDWIERCKTYLDNSNTYKEILESILESEEKDSSTKSWKDMERSDTSAFRNSVLLLQSNT